MSFIEFASEKVQSVITWAKENEISSEGNVKLEDLQGLLADAKELLGELVHVDGQKKLNGLFFHSPYKKGSSVTNDEFDQVVLYSALDKTMRRLKSLGFDIERIISASHEGNKHPVMAHANQVDDLNAWYSRLSHELTFGTATGIWHLASDTDVVVHELGHLILDHIQPDFGRGRIPNEGYAIHEAFGDMLATIINNDPELSEDFIAYKGGTTNPDKGMREATNQLKLSEVGFEPHARSLPYTGFFWSVRTKLTDPSGKYALNESAANDIMLKILLAHAYEYSTRRPQSVDFMQAMIAGVVILSRSEKLGIPSGPLREFMIEEGLKRELVTSAQAEILRGFEVASTPNIALKDTQSLFGQKVRFVKDHHAPVNNGSVEIWQQEYLTNKHGYVEVLGGGLHMRKYQQTNMANQISTSDAYQIVSSKVDETINIAQNTAITLIKQRAEKRYESVKIDLQRARQQPRDHESLSKYYMEKRIVESTLQAIADYSSENAADLVLDPSTNTLQYKFNFPYETYFVDTKDGGVIAENTAIIN